MDCHRARAQDKAQNRGGPARQLARGSDFCLAAAERPPCPAQGPDAGVCDRPLMPSRRGDKGVGVQGFSAGACEERACAGAWVREACAKRWPSDAVRASAGTARGGASRGGRGTSRPRQGAACEERTGEAVSARSARAPGMRRVAKPARRAEARSSPTAGEERAGGGVGYFVDTTQAGYEKFSLLCP